MGKRFGGDPDVSVATRNTINERSPANHVEPGLYLQPLDLNHQLEIDLVRQSRNASTSLFFN